MDCVEAVMATKGRRADQPIVQMIGLRLFRRAKSMTGASQEMDRRSS